MTTTKNRKRESKRSRWNAHVFLVVIIIHMYCTCGCGVHRIRHHSPSYRIFFMRNTLHNEHAHNRTIRTHVSNTLAALFGLVQSRVGGADGSVGYSTARRWGGCPEWQNKVSAMCMKRWSSISCKSDSSTSGQQKEKYTARKSDGIKYMNALSERNGIVSRKNGMSLCNADNSLPNQRRALRTKSTLMRNSKILLRIY